MKAAAQSPEFRIIENDYYRIGIYKVKHYSIKDKVEYEKICKKKWFNFVLIFTII